MSNDVTFESDWISPPGDTILDILKAKNITLKTLASKFDEDIAYINSLIIGEVVLNCDIAEKLSLLLGASKSFWLNRESQFRHDLNRLKASIDSQENISHWLRALPINELVANDWIANVTSISDQFQECLSFFDVTSITEWKNSYSEKLATTAFKKSETFSQDFAAVVSWLRQGEILSSKQEVEVWNQGLFISRLSEIRTLTREPSPDIFLPQLIDICASCGVAVVIAKAPKGCRSSGATKFINSQKALLMLSCRFLSDDQFWFAFFHEAAHLILHGNKLILEEEGIQSVEETEANNFAFLALFPGNSENELKELNSDHRSVIRLARKLGISRGIVVGQLQRLGVLRHNQLNNLKVRYRWK